MRLQIVLIGLAMSCEGAHRDRDGMQSFVPSNAPVFGDFGSDELTVAPPDGSFDTDHDCTATSALGACTALTDACVCRAATISIGTLHVTGSRMLVLLASRELTVGTLLDVGGHGATPGPGAIAGYGSAADAATNAAGGSFGTEGAADSRGSGAIAAGYGEPTLVPLVGGMTGQDGDGGSGGGGGGGVQLSAGDQLEIDGAIDASGGGGLGGTSTFSSDGAGAGGAGGGVLLEGASVVVDGMVRANGGAGGGGGGTDGWGTSGQDGSASPARGGNPPDPAGCPLYGYVLGGGGGDGATGSGSATWGGYADSNSQCIGPVSFVGAGGGGGGLGRIHVSSATGCDCNGTFSPAPTFGTVEAR
ncbi:MAG TPA: hypothetical protein VGL61_22215 [Kofleriaceae bacterium]|jgi:hypothetical protein